MPLGSHSLFLKKLFTFLSLLVVITHLTMHSECCHVLSLFVISLGVLNLPCWIFYNDTYDIAIGVSISRYNLLLFLSLNFL